ncbi:4Fe-4S dicluster domain-containing protein [Desulfuribacillus alkaliarsenatis]|uniref:4Fe-4S ferredoxin-type domain-containing protein n=1 Tax=Desulfuribacillus alkaliarsenatis TaxID=766136 RepID=A0A1E5G3S8_9FIRM|nr:4Fe-4S dicluster domain-containing protein [Desulfuribacillus alkaliarsenatis]OEF97676.1 hypothetical protein BHF68_14335 [Desulfuribacillus alkaliarsenatis]
MLEKKIDRRNLLKIGTTSAVVGTALLFTGCEEEAAAPIFTDATKTAILMDTSLCVECHACRVACQNHNALPVEQSYIKFESVEKGSFPKVEYHLSRNSCMHCTDAPCVDICPVKALYKGDTGFTHMNYDACIGCGMCKMQCPYDVPVIAEVDSARKMFKCQGCEDLITEGQEPACVNTCIANSLKYGPVEEMIDAAKARVEVLKVKYPKANVYGVTQQDGLGLILILRDDAKEFKLVYKDKVTSLA